LIICESLHLNLLLFYRYIKRTTSCRSIRKINKYE
jgi:hypothetical protein